ncbi:putative purine permease 11 isoform X1 [Iris pallida]|uniref:Purine permease 11 isoform X1 n=1 Tax=Iris pallida TaxID=29817 RepID=A0AAX6HYM8_IRIPA|nr:putative purine permease 11 isoform X1 [Iris pallida]KAJ6845595.1 putative purine permease 11 isoform X1 [Iris pallida]
MVPRDPQVDTHLQELLTTQHHTPPSTTMHEKWSWWLTVSLHTVLLLVGQTAATLLTRFYYDQGGSSKWLETLTFSAAFPILYIPLLFFNPSSSVTYRPPLLSLFLTYTSIGLITTADSLMYSYSLLYLPVSTYSLVCATQLAFNAVFSYFINSEKFTHFTINSVVVLTFSAAILGLRSGSDSDTVGHTKGNSSWLCPHPCCLRHLLSHPLPYGTRFR